MSCLIITTLAQEFAEEVRRLSGGRIEAIACKTADEARASYTNQTIVFGSPGMIAEVIDEMPAVEWVQSSWAGVTPLIDAPRRDYVLTGIKGVFGTQMAEYVLGYLLAHELKIHDRREAQQKRHWYREFSGSLAGKRIGIMGTGSIGGAIANAAAAFEMERVGLSRSGHDKSDFDRVYPTTELDDFLTSVDYLVSTLPATPETDRLLDARALANLPPGAVFVNVGRSNVINDDALIDSLRTGHLAAAVLDVFDEEPLPESSPLWTTPNLTVTAHIAAVSHPLLIVPVFVENYERYVKGEPLEYIIDFERGY